MPTTSAEIDNAFASPPEWMPRWAPTPGSRPGTDHNVPHVIERRPWNRNGNHQPLADAMANGRLSATVVIPAPATSGTAAVHPPSCTRRAMSGGRNNAGTPWRRHRPRSARRSNRRGRRRTRARPRPRARRRADPSCGTRRGRTPARGSRATPRRRSRTSMRTRSNASAAESADVASRNPSGVPPTHDATHCASPTTTGYSDRHPTYGSAPA